MLAGVASRGRISVLLCVERGTVIIWQVLIVIVHSSRDGF